MKVVVSFPNRGPLGASIQFEDELPDETVNAIRNALLPQLVALCSQQRKLTLEASPSAETKNSKISNFNPPSPEALNALRKAVATANTSLEVVCKEHAVDPHHISKGECWKMTDELNKKTGFSKEQEERRKHSGQFPNSRNLPDDSDIFE